jgi:hypothetical protein
MHHSEGAAELDSIARVCNTSSFFYNFNIFVRSPTCTMIPSSVRYCTVSYGSTEVLSYEGRATKVSIFVPSKVHYVYVYMYVYNKLFLLSNFRKYESTFVQPFMTTVHVRVHVRVQYMYVQRREKKRICVLYSILVGLRKYNYTYTYSSPTHTCFRKYTYVYSTKVLVRR